jgi:hypothetical protein
MQFTMSTLLEGGVYAAAVDAGPGIAVGEERGEGTGILGGPRNGDVTVPTPGRAVLAAPPP